jgi:hypothetical protein
MDFGDWQFLVTLIQNIAIDFIRVNENEMKPQIRMVKMKNLRG